MLLLHENSSAFGGGKKKIKQLRNSPTPMWTFQTSISAQGLFKPLFHHELTIALRAQSTTESIPGACREWLLSCKEMHVWVQKGRSLIPGASAKTGDIPKV